MNFVTTAYGCLHATCLFLSLSLTIASAQQPTNIPAADPESPQPISDSPTSAARLPAWTDSQPQKGNPAEIGPMVRIGPGDELDIAVFGLPELSQHTRVNNSGDVSLPLVGKLHLGGLSSDGAEALIEKRLADGHFVNNPHVSVYLKDYTTEGISLTGEVNRPGVYSPLGPHRLLDLIQTAGGLTNKAGVTVTVAHRQDPTHPTVLTLSDDPVKAAANNIELSPGDTIVVSKAGIIYVVGEVNRPGGFVMQSNEITVSQVLAMAAGPTRMASLNGAKLIRRTSKGLENTPLRLKKVLQAKIPDIRLDADDIIWVPSSKGKAIASATTYTALNTLATLAIYRF
jgi:polysaccharide biosynthesis/export protein